MGVFGTRPRWSSRAAFGAVVVGPVGAIPGCPPATPKKPSRVRMLTPASFAPPFAAYAHGVEIPAAARIVLTSGQLALARDGTVPEGTEAQAALCFQNCAAILVDAGMGMADVVRINAYVTDRSHMAGCMTARDGWLAGIEQLPAFTLVIVAGFTPPEFLVEVPVTAARL